MRGALSLFANIFQDTETPTTPRKKGRSPELHRQRNECLTHRYFFYCQHTDKKYEAILRILSAEFFISEVTIPELLNNYTKELHALKKENPPKAYFAKKYPHFSW